MDLYCVMGNPVEHSRSPWIHARFAELTGQTLRYDRRRVELDGFADGVAAFRGEASGTARGCNVTVPFKFDAARLANRRSERATLADAANVLSFAEDGSIDADNSDGAGLVADIEQHAARPLAGVDLLLLGAGGGASGVLGPLLQGRPRRLVVANRTLSRAIELVQRHAALALASGVSLEAQALGDVQGTFDLVVNATASSLAGGEVPVSASVLQPGTLAIDMMYGPAAAGFMQWARRHGAIPRDGLGMLVEQAAEAFAVWRGVRPPTQDVLAELRAIVDRA
ncbi:Shikimate dehydrogenase (NADP(+)) [Burkholderiales bacterium 8X]|nr:Shikimate dehydrogenase (NADP(+)) [Burkholderiales bacterium 8X]